MHWWTSSNPIGLLFDNIWNVERAQRDYITLDALGMLLVCCYRCCVVVVGNCFSLSLINIIIMIRTCVNIIRFHNSLVMLTIHSKKGWFAAVVWLGRSYFETFHKRCNKRLDIVLLTMDLCHFWIISDFWGKVFLKTTKFLYLQKFRTQYIQYKTKQLFYYFHSLLRVNSHLHYFKVHSALALLLTIWSMYV